MHKYKSDLRRREALKLIAAVLGGGHAWGESSGMGTGEYRLSSFTEDVTPPMGNPLFNAVRARATVNPLQAHGLVLSGSDKPIVLVAVD